MAAKLVWVTPDAENIMAYCARVSSPDNQHNTSTADKLLKYCYSHGHFSVFEMASMCIEVTTSRAISAQLLRHRSFSFQEFSQRYAKATAITSPGFRAQDTTNRQNSLDIFTEEQNKRFSARFNQVTNSVIELYEELLEAGVAKECARMILPMATESKLYMTGTIRSWMHYIKLRTDVSTQLEHRDVANEIKAIFVENMPFLGELLEK